MRDAMNGLYVYSIMVGGSLLAIIWISRRYDVPLYGQAEIAFFFGAFMLWAVIMTGLCSPFQSSVLVAQQNRNPALAATPSDNRVSLEKFFRYATTFWTTTASACAGTRGSGKRRS